MIDRLKKIFLENGIEVSYNLDDELLFDSLQFISIITDIEDAFNIKINDEDLLYTNFKCFNDFYKYIQKKERSVIYD